MTEAQARARIEDETAWNSAPALSVEEVDRLLEAARVTDEDGLEPGEVGYTDTWNEAGVYRAVAMGFRWKAAKVSGSVDLKAGDVSLARSQAATALSRRAASAAGIRSIGIRTVLGEA
jgi:hypothetical protein